MERRPKRREKTLSLYGIDPRMALRRMLNTPAPAKKGTKKRKPKKG